MHYKLLIDFSRNLLKKDFLLQSYFSRNSYEQLISSDQQFGKRFKVKILAGYFGIHPNILSKIRKDRNLASAKRSM